MLLILLLILYLFDFIEFYLHGNINFPLSLPERRLWLLGHIRPSTRHHPLLMIGNLINILVTRGVTSTLLVVITVLAPGQ